MTKLRKTTSKAKRFCRWLDIYRHVFLFIAFIVAFGFASKFGLLPDFLTETNEPLSCIEEGGEYDAESDTCSFGDPNTAKAFLGVKCPGKMATMVYYDLIKTISLPEKITKKCAIMQGEL